MQLEFYKQNNPRFFCEEKITYYTSFTCDNFHNKKWGQSKGFDIYSMMDRCEVKPCKDASLGTHTEFWDHWLGKMLVDAHFVMIYVKLLNMHTLLLYLVVKKRRIRTTTTKL